MGLGQKVWSVFLGAGTGTLYLFGCLLHLVIEGFFVALGFVIIFGILYLIGC